ncbi:hypothetical protein CYY_003817 [Polysphondylium violaceum]|uniref:DH domain-containing protein n=1 Tax=Polysphondylium violaceum TaxID=133409 RepID=A0A8J4PU76_9MYCE|nr:hypothetical protein CYY_003817 [Polysphondylium violaceum]
MGNNVSASKVNESNAEDAGLKKRRELILEEILTTEKAYVNYLSMVLEVYIDPIKAKSILKEENFNSLFSNIEQIQHFHVQFFTELAICFNSFSWSNEIAPLSPTLTKTTVTQGRDRKSTVTTVTTVTTTTATDESKANARKSKKPKEITSLESTTSITEIFNKNKENFRMYSTYIITYDSAMTTLARLKKKKDFSNFLDKAKGDSRANGLDLTSLLIMPVQRLPRYVLLLNELLKNTPENHPNAKLLDKCIQGIKEVTIFINEAKRDDENHSKLNTIQDSLIDKVTMMDSNRKLIIDGELSIHSIFPLKEEEALLKRIKKYRKAKQKDTIAENTVFLDEFKQPKDLNYCIFNDCFVLFQKAPKSFFNSTKTLNVLDVSLSAKTRVIEVLDIFNFKNYFLIITEKSIYFGNLVKNSDKDKFIKAVLMTKYDTSSTNTLTTSLSTSSDLPSILTLRPEPVLVESGKSFFSNLVSSSSSTTTTTTSTTKDKEKEKEKEKKNQHMMVNQQKKEAILHLVERKILQLDINVMQNALPFFGNNSISLNNGSDIWIILK